MRSWYVIYRCKVSDNLVLFFSSLVTNVDVGILVHSRHMVGGMDSLSAISNFNRSVDSGIMDSIINFGITTALLSHWKMYYYILTN